MRVRRSVRDVPAGLPGRLPSELQSQLDLPHTRCVRLRAHRAEVGARDVRLDASEDDGVEQIEHVDAESELRPRHAEIAASAPTGSAGDRDCHEGTWHELDRTWTIRTDGREMRLMHRRTMDMEINGHEWWSWNGKRVWFDLQTPRSQDFWIAGADIAGGKETRYHLERDWWGVHFNSSRDDTLFASDGGDASQVAYAADGQWINLLRVASNGTLTREKLVNMSTHNYVTGRGGVEPNVHITPDKKWVVFTGQFAPGQRHVYAVQVNAQAAGGF
jgi:hypothetical protein